MKNARHQQILKLISKRDIETQEELASLLNESGFAVTQATVSRDIRQLQLHKINNGSGKQKYVASPDVNIDFKEKYNRALKDAFVSVDFSSNIMVIRTIAGMAMPAAAALDAFDWPEILGCIAGDDTIMCVLRSQDDQGSVYDRINSIMNMKLN